MHEELIVERQDDVTHLVINRPDRANALNVEIVEKLIDALHAAAADGTRVLTLRGNGKSLCSGFDLSALETETDGDLALRFLRIEQLLQLLHHSPMETIAFAHGRVYGAGADLFCACSRRVCAPGATFRFPGVRFGVVLGTRRLGSRVGESIAREALLEGREFSSDDATSSGLGTLQLPQEQWADYTRQVRRDIEKVSPVTARSIVNCLQIDTREADMTALAVSVAEPGFKQRIAAYRDRLRKGNQ